MDAQFLSRRLNDLADHIDRDWGLLKEYEDLLHDAKATQVVNEKA